MTATDTETGPEDAFFALQQAQADEAARQASAAPYGYTTDPDGTTRPKLAAGRPKKPPSVDELKAATTVNEAVPDADRAPEAPKRTRSRRKADPKPETPAPQYREGVIAKGVNRLYRKAGKIVRAMDADIGEAIIQAARNTADPGESDDSVGAAWDELARTNPRIRKFLMKVITGGAWGNLLMAHAPIAMAIIMKPAILRFIPLAGLMESMAEPDEDTPEGEGGLPGGMTAGDAQAMADLAQAQAARMGLSIPPEVAEKMAAMAGSMMNGGGMPQAPPARTRNQPRRPASRADRHGK